MHDATSNRTQLGFTAEGESGGIAVWMVIYAVLMVTAMTFFADANLIGDRFDRAAIAFNDPM